MKTSLAACRGAAGNPALELELGLADRSAPARQAIETGELAARIAIVVGFSFLALRLGAHVIETGRLTGLLLLASEALVVVLTMFRRSTGVVDRSPRARILTTLSLMGPLFVVPASAYVFLPDAATVALSAVGLVIVIGGKLSLGRSFGLMPANRGVVSTGLYRIVRHPIYMGYLICHVGFVAANGAPWNLLTLLAADIALMIRAICEERVLALDPAYRDYQQKVRWRIIPGLF
jgi:protein-S-isoprenylcysteine O-methyltransferase Ste14